MEKIRNKKLKTKESNKKELDSTNARISFILALFFWIPLLNLFPILPASMYFGIKAMVRVKKHPKIFGGFKLALFSVIWASISFIFSAVVLILYIQGKI